MDGPDLRFDPNQMSAEISGRIDMLAAITATPGALTRLYMTPEHRRAADLLLDWMREAGMAAHIDGAGNVIGRYEGEKPGLPALLLGSHYDTVRNAGKWDGPLGVVAAIACVGNLSRRNKRLPFAIEVAAFGDEEGVRFPLALTGSRAFSGTFPKENLDTRDFSGVMLRDALRDFGLDPEKITQAAHKLGQYLAYVELHIEQGPVLESKGLALGVVSAISGLTRLRVEIDGMAGHAGTVPMTLRRDALAGAAECILAVERYCRMHDALVGTVGFIDAKPGATNVIPGKCIFTVDMRTVDDAKRKQAVAEIIERIEGIAATRGLGARVTVMHENATVPCAPWLKSQLAAAIGGTSVIEIASGAGHDGMAVSAITDIAMIFVRCRGGISHNPAEHVDTADVAAGAGALMRFVENFTPQA